MLIELYVSEGCSGCKEAERRLEGLTSMRSSRELLAIVLPLHEEAGAQKDAVLAKRERARRDFRRARLGRPRPLEVPLFLLQGEPRQDWRSPSFERQLDRLVAGRALARLALTLETQGSKPGLQVRLEAELEPSSPLRGAALYLAPVRLKNDVTGPYAAWGWSGPFWVERGRAFARSQRLMLPAGPSPEMFGAAAFLQDRSSGEVLQSLVLDRCRE